MISREKYNELVNSQKYVVGMDWGGGDTLFSYDTQDPACYVGKQIPPMKFQDIRGKALLPERKIELQFWHFGEIGVHLASL